ncbi:MAG: hypothetical protein ACPL7K_04045, partial [Armatimonadota bacterium]
MYRLLTVLALVVALATCPWSAQALTLLSPSPDQVVREKVKIAIPVNELPAGFVVGKDETVPEKGRPFVTLSVVEGGLEQLVAAISPDAGIVKGGAFIFYWDSKAPYRDPKDAKKERFWKDGKHTLKVGLYDFLGKLMDTATVDVNLRNKIPRSNPAPAVSLVNRLVFGESHAYKVHAEVQVFHIVSGTALPILGGMGMTSDFKIVQSVEDKRPDGSYLLRCRMDPKGYISSMGKKVELFPNERPELYRLVDKYGNVINRNVFSRQGKYTMMDVLPVLPRGPVREGDSWPVTCDLKVEGITGVIPLKGTSQLDSFEWQDGHECARIISVLTGTSQIWMDNGRIRSSEGHTVTATTVTFFAYKTGKMIYRETTLEFPANILPGAGEIEGSETSGPSGYPGPPGPGAEPMSDEDLEPMRGPYRSPG